jgi:hypothetical protein
MPTFREMYPEYYTDEYQAQPQVGPPETYTPPQSDPADLYALQNAPMYTGANYQSPVAGQQYGMLNLPTHLRTEYQRAGGAPKYEDINPPIGALGRTLIRLTGGNYERDYAAQKQQYEANQAGIEFGKARKNVLLSQAEMQLAQAYTQTEPGPVRQAILDNWNTLKTSQGAPFTKPVLDLMKKADDDHIEAMKYVNQALIPQMFPNLTPDQQKQMTDWMNSTPEGNAKLFSLLATAQQHMATMEKTQEETKKAKLENEMMRREMEGEGTVPQGQPQGQPSPQPIPNVKPTQAAFEQRVDEIGRAMGASDHVKQMVKATGAIETKDYDPNAVSPAGAEGVLQFMAPTARQYGVQDRRNVDQSIAGALKYYTKLNQLFPGKPELQFAGYNAGEDKVMKAGNQVPDIKETQGYVQKGMQRYLQKPATESMATAPPQQQQAFQDVTQEMDRLDQAMRRMEGLRGVPFIKNKFEGMKERYDRLAKKQDYLLNLYAPKPPSEVSALSEAGIPEKGVPALPWPMQKPGPKATILEKIQAGKEQAQARQGEQAVAIQPLSDAARKNLRVFNPKTNDYEKIDPTLNQAGLQALKQSGAQVVHMEPVEGKAEDAYKGLQASKDSVETILPLLQDPAVTAQIGNIFSNPQGWLDTVKNKTGKELGTGVYQMKSELSRLQADLQRFYAGTAQTAVEVKTLDPFLVHMTDATPQMVKTKLEELHTMLTRRYESDRRFDLKGGKYVAPLSGPAEPPQVTLAPPLRTPGASVYQPKKRRSPLAEALEAKE